MSKSERFKLRPLESLQRVPTRRKPCSNGPYIYDTFARGTAWDVSKFRLQGHLSTEQHCPYFLRQLQTREYLSLDSNNVGFSTRMKMESTPLFVTSLLVRGAWHEPRRMLD